MNNHLDEKNKLEKMNEELANSKAILEHLIKAYSSAYIVDLDNDSFEILHMNHSFQQIFTMNGSRKDMENFIRNNVHPDDQAKIFQLIDSKYIKQRLEKEDEITFTMRERYDGQERTMHAVIMKTSSPNTVAVGFMDVTAEMQKEQDANHKILNANRNIENFRRAMLKHALLAFTANLTTNEIISGFWVNDEGHQVSLKQILDMELPCSYDEYIKRWREKFVSSTSDEVFYKLTNRDYLIKSYREGKTEISFDYQANTISGTNKYLRRSINIIEDDSGDLIAYSNAKDITEQMQQQISIHLQEKIINRLAENYLDVYQIDVKTQKVKALRTSGKAVGIADAIKRETKYQDAIKIYVANNVFDEDQKDMIEATTFNKVYTALSKEGRFVYHYRAHIKEANHYYRMQVVPVGEGNQITHMVAGFACEDEEKAKEKLLNDALIASQNASQAKTTFLFNMSHDIRTPMNAIIGFTDLAEKHIDEKERVLDCLKKVKVSSEHLLSLINDVLDMSRVEAGKVKLEEKPLLIDTTMNNLHSILAGSAEEKNISLSMQVDSSITHHWIYGDRLRMMRVLTNVISNSVKYTKPNGRIDVLLSELPSLKEEYAHLQYCIRDNGIGMSKEFVEHIFEPFARAENSTLSGVAGTGLGMAITKSLVELMGGTIKIESELGVGTIVYIDVHKKIAEPIDFTKDCMEIDNTILKGKKVLLVEDNVLNREIATEILQEEGMTVNSVENGQMAVDEIKASKVGKYDLILMDIQMPVMNGYEATRQIRKLYNNPLSVIPIIAMTANAFEEDKQNAFNAGMDAHVAKPIDVKTLMQVLTNILKR